MTGKNLNLKGWKLSLHSLSLQTYSLISLFTDKYHNV